MNKALIEMHNTARSIAEAAGKFILSRRPQGKELGEILKYPDSGADLKTQTDIASDALIRKLILEAYPDHGIISEEDIPIVSTSSYRWVVDPLDGTRSWLRNMSDHFAVSIAIECNGVSVIGIVNAPALWGGSMYTAIKGHGAFLNDERITVSCTDFVPQTQLAVDYGKRNKGYILELEKKLFGISGGVDSLYKLGGSSVGASLVASGHLDGALMYGLDHWDLAAAKLILEEAGACITVTTDENGLETLVASNPALQQKLCVLLFG